MHFLPCFVRHSQIKFYRIYGKWLCYGLLQGCAKGMQTEANRTPLPGVAMSVPRKWQAWLCHFGVCRSAKNEWRLEYGHSWGMYMVAMSTADSDRYFNPAVPCCPPRLLLPTKLNSFASISAPCQMRIPSVVNARTLSSWGPEKKRAFYLIWSEAIFSLCLCITCLNGCTSDPLISHGHHVSRTVHALCNVQVILTNGILCMGEQADDPDEMFTFE